MTVDEFAGICDKLVARFGNYETTEISIFFGTNERQASGFGFDSIDDLKENANKIVGEICNYSVEISGEDELNGLKILEISRSLRNNQFQLKAIAQARSRSDGWCADIIETTLVEYRRYASKFDFLYNNFVISSIPLLAGLITGGIISRLFFGNEGEESALSYQESGLLVLCGTSVVFVIWIIYSALVRGSTAKIRLGKKKVEWTTIILLTVSVLQLGANVVSILMSKT